MKKGVVIGGSVAGLALLGAAAAPYLIGMKAESSLIADHEIMAEEIVLPGLSINLDSYQRGYLSAEAITAITFTPEARDAVPIRLELHHRISHLPNLAHFAIASATSELVLPPELQKEADKFLGGQPPLTIYTYIGVTGSQSAEITSPAFKTARDDKATTIEWRGIQGTGRKSGDSTEVSNDIAMPGFIVNSAADNLAVNDLRYKSDMKRGSYDLWFGTSDASLKSLQFSTKEETGTRTVALNDLQMTSAQREEGELTHGNVIFQFGKSLFDEVTLESAVYDFEYRNFDSKTLSEIQANLRQAYTDSDAELLGAAILGSVPALLKAKPEINIRRLEVKSTLGNFMGKFHLAFAGEWNDEMMGNPMAMLPMLNADLDLTISKSLLVSLGHSQMRSSIAAMAEEQGEELSDEEIDTMARERAAQQLEVLAANEYLLEKGDLYITKIHFEKSELTINGKTANELFGAPAR